MQNERWTHDEEWEDCSLCFGTGVDGCEIDGKCIYCAGIGETLQTKSTCNWCEEPAAECNCNSEILNNADKSSASSTGEE